MAAACGRAARANRLRFTGAASKLIATGAVPAAAYGASGGFAPKHLHRLRVLAAKAVVGTGTSCCLTTALALSGKPMADPGIRLREAIVLWTKLARKLPEPKRASLSRAWGRAVAAFRKLDGKSLWKLVKGPMTATIATLLDIGWDPCNPTLWKDERGDEWDISRTDVSFGDLIPV